MTKQVQGVTRGVTEGVTESVTCAVTLTVAPARTPSPRVERFLSRSTSGVTEQSVTEPKSVTEGVTRDMTSSPLKGDGHITVVPQLNQRETVMALLADGLTTTQAIASRMGIGQPRVRTCLCKLKREGLTRVLGVDGDFAVWELVDPDETADVSGPAPKLHPAMKWAYADRLPRLASVFDMGATSCGS